MLFGRHVERGLLDSLLRDARAGRSGSLLLRGEVGIGKSALCSYAVEQAAGMTVLAARGSETERDLAFAGLAQLFRAELGRLDGLPAPQGAALAGALAVGPPVEVDRFTVCAAVLSLLAAIAEASPVLVVVDDAEWLDRSSSEALAFAARRLAAAGVAVGATLGDGRPTALDRAGLPERRIPALDAATAAELLAGLAPSAVAAGVADRVLHAAAGNPLVLVEIAGSLDEDQLRGAAALPDE